MSEQPTEKPTNTTQELLVSLTRPFITACVAVTLCGLAVGKGAGGLPLVPDWYLSAFIVGGMTNVLGWQVARQVAKKRGTT